jgi:multiple sugar transport system substrate-binding protein
MKKFLGLALLCAVAGVFAACSKDKVTTLNFLEVMTSPTRTEVLKGIIAEYEAAHPDIKINLISPPYEQADNRLTLSLTAK